MKQKHIIVGICVVLLLVFGVRFLSTPEPKVSEDVPRDTDIAAATQTEETPQAIFDVPKLIGKDADEVRLTLGEPRVIYEPTPEQERLGPVDADMSFVISDVDLLVIYDSHTRVVKEFFISTTDPSGQTQNTDLLLRIGNLEQNAATYVTKFIPVINNPLAYTGVAVTPR